MPEVELEPTLPEGNRILSPERLVLRGPNLSVILA